MRDQNSGGVYLLKLEIGDEVVRSVCEFAKRQEIRAATVSAIGGVADPVLGYFNLITKQYDEREFNGNFELIGLSGNIAMKDGEPFLHAHAVVGSSLSVHAGHLVRATICVTGEFVITPLDCHLERQPDDATGLALWHIS